MTLAGDSKSQASSHLCRPELRIGDTIAQNAYSGRGEMLLSAGSIITTYHQVVRLSRPDVQTGCYIPTRDKSLEASEPTENDEQSDILEATEVKAAVVQDISDIFLRLQTCGEIDINVIESAAEKLKQEMYRNSYALSSLAMIKEADAYTFMHSVNVSIISMSLALRTPLREYIDEIGVGSLLHDIGKVDVPLDILHKSGPLDGSEMNTMKRHPLHGAQILRGLGYQDKIAISCVLEHHEKLSGRGYPLRKQGDAISPYGRLTAIADVFDALTTDRPYRKAMSAHDAVVIMTHNMRGDLDPILLEEFKLAIGEVAKYAAEVGGGEEETPFGTLRLEVSEEAAPARGTGTSGFSALA